MICMPGVTLVAFSDTSVSRLISMPGEISTYSDASPARGRNPCATVPRNAAYCGWRLSRKQYARSSIPPLVTGCPSRQDLHARRGADAGGAGGDHVPHVLSGPDASRRLDAQ